MVRLQTTGQQTEDEKEAAGWKEMGKYRGEMKS